ncbi:DUF6843 domain-containing protein [Planococcus versutus]|uniref:DUF6843 domain-containing protein n=1 Tax=Planococcus versutus TaxID=1302659 RepID=A0A1B1S1J4_9BACL|nr:hypothetical protein [Planococcus versutus]ANU27065.1 hypothetical protein I858_008685 [Planococcus versutus]
MKKWILAGSVILLVLTTWWVRRESQDNKIIYLVPNGQSGCHTILFNQPNGKSLELHKDVMVIAFDKGGNLRTSSSTALTSFGGTTEAAYYVNEQGERLEEIEHENYLNASLTSNGTKESYTLSFDGRENFCP